MTWQQTIDDEKEDAYEEGYSQGIAQGISQGASQKAVEAAENFLRMNVLSFEQVSQGTGLTLDQVKEIAEKLTVKA